MYQFHDTIISHIYSVNLMILIPSPPNFSQIYLSSTIPYSNFISSLFCNSLSQFVLPIYTWVWGHPLKHSLCTRGHNPWRKQQPSSVNSSSARNGSSWAPSQSVHADNLRCCEFTHTALLSCPEVSFTPSSLSLVPQSFCSGLLSQTCSLSFGGGQYRCSLFVPFKSHTLNLSVLLLVVGACQCRFLQLSLPVIELPCVLSQLQIHSVPIPQGDWLV